MSILPENAVELLMMPRLGKLKNLQLFIDCARPSGDPDVLHYEAEYLKKMFEALKFTVPPTEGVGQGRAKPPPSLLPALETLKVQLGQEGYASSPRLNINTIELLARPLCDMITSMIGRRGTAKLKVIDIAFVGGKVDLCQIDVTRRALSGNWMMDPRLRFSISDTGECYTHLSS
jgi:hypothetical protein